MNKYQEALDFLNTRCNVANRKNYFKRKEAVATLQELIDKCSKDSCEYPYHIVDEIREQWGATEQTVEKLAKALDKACKEIIYYQTKLNGKDFTNTIEQLKEWCLRDE